MELCELEESTITQIGAVLGRDWPWCLYSALWWRFYSIFYFFDFMQFDFECMRKCSRLLINLFLITLPINHTLIIIHSQSQAQIMQQEKPQSHDKHIPTRVVTVSPRSKHHKHTIIWIHGLHETPEKYLHMFHYSLFDNFKIIAPEAPTRYVTLIDKEVTSWFDIKFRSEKSFTVPFDQAFSTAEVNDSFERIIKPLIYGAREELNAVNPGGKLIIAGFSQGCGMSLHSFYSYKQKVDAVIGLSGYLFPFTPFQETTRYHQILYGKSDNLRPWEYVKTTYKDKIHMDKISLVEGTGHEINQAIVKLFHYKIQQLFGL